MTYEQREKVLAALRPMAVMLAVVWLGCFVAIIYLKVSP